MIRHLIITAALLILPFAAYAIYQLSRSRDGKTRKGLLDNAPMRLLAVIGLVLAFAGMVGFGIYETIHAGPAYVPPIYRPPGS